MHPVLKPLKEFEKMPVPFSVTMWCCQDGTCHFGVKHIEAALPVYVFPNAEDALAVQVVMCFTVHKEHPSLPKGEPWYKFNDVRESGFLDVDDRTPVFDVSQMPRLTAKIDAVYKEVKKRHA